jgi:UTP--glucose-1-phosphate uridylyltransferase
VRVTKAVIPAAGLGTRFLPATKAMPKEMIPVVDRPQIQYSIEEAGRAGIIDILLITSRGKGIMEDHFDRDLELEAHLEGAGKTEELAEVRRIADLARIFGVRQKEPLGWGHAVLQARDHIGNEPFVIMLPDEVVPEPMGAEVPLLERMIDIFEEKGAASVVAVQEVPMESISAYGCVDPEPIKQDLVRIVSIVEKPAPEDAPSNLGARGRYVVTPEIFDAIERTPPGVGGEIQFTDALNLLAQERIAYAFVHSGPMLDVGNKLDHLYATIELALRRDDLSKPLREFLTELTSRLD